jgi:hypothetical protein
MPSVGWSCDAPHVIKTEWSDHSIVWADCYVTLPKVERASPAPCIKKLSHLPSSFWSTVIADFNSLSESPSLTAWMSFKSCTLSLYSRTSRAIKVARDKGWQRALRGDLLNPDDFILAMRAWSSYLDVPPAAPAPAPKKSTQWTNACPLAPHTSYKSATNPGQRAWRSALSTLVTKPLHGWKFSPPAHPPFSPIVCPASREPNAPFWVVHPPTARPPCPSLWVPLAIPRPPLDVTKMYSLQLAACRAALKKRMLAISLSHSSEWFNLSNNKAVDERGSRASVSVQGLRLPTVPVATTDLTSTANIAREHFVMLHSLTPCSPLQRQEQTALLALVHSESSLAAGPTTFKSGPFSEDEILSLKKKMPSTSPGPDGIPYLFWKELAKRLDEHASLHPDSL